MSNTRSLPNSTYFSFLPNELVLIIWTYLGHAEAIRIFESMKCQRYTCLLKEYCFKSINFRETSLSTFLHYCSHLFDIIRSDVETLKLGHRTSYCQLRLFTQAHSESIPLSEMFPKLQTLVLFNIPQASCGDLQFILTLVPFLQHLTLDKCSFKTVASSIRSNLLAHGLKSRLRSLNLCSKDRNNGFTLHEPMPSTYEVQQSLIDLRIDIHDLVSLKNLLTFLPNLVTLDARICTHVKRNDKDLFISYSCPCIHLTKLTFRMYAVVEYFPSALNFLLLFRDHVRNLDLAFIHADPMCSHLCVHIDGNILFNELLIHMIQLEKINFCVETACSCNAPMDSIIKSFQSEYWKNVLVAYHFDRLSGSHIIFSLPFAFSDYFLITTDVMETSFNQIGYDLNDLVPMLFAKTRQTIVKFARNEKVGSSFVHLLQQGSYRGHRISLRLCGPCYIEENNNHHLKNFDKLILIPSDNILRKEELVSFTMTWLDWMSHLRLLNIDSQMLSKLLPTINLNGTIEKFSSLEELIICQLDIPLDEDTLEIVAQLGTSSSLRSIEIRGYKTLNSQPIDNNSFISTICQICSNMCKLETFTIDFVNEHLFCENYLFDELTGTEKKMCQLECIYLSDNAIDFWLEK